MSFDVQNMDAGDLAADASAAEEYGALPAPAQANRRPDQLRDCEHCGIIFLWSSEEQAAPAAKPEQATALSPPNARDGESQVGQTHEAQEDSAQTTMMQGDADQEDQNQEDRAREDGAQETDAPAAAADAPHAQEQEAIAPSTSSPTLCPGCRRLLPQPGRERGLVKWFNARKRYGFLIRYDAAEIFAHGSAIQGRARLHPGDLVEFSVTMRERGPEARAVTLLQKNE